MKAMQLTGSSLAVDLRETDAAEPQPSGPEVLIKVAAVGVTPSELSWFPTTHNKDGSARVNAIPGHEFCGTILKTGMDDARFQIGDSVYGMNDWYSGGAAAEVCLSRPEWLAYKPASLTDEEAATVPIAALTAWQGLFVHADLRQGERVLVHGGAGSVGSFAVQLAALRGAHVVSTTARESFQYVTDLGASECVDYRQQRFEERILPVDVVFDTVGGDTLARSWQILKPSGRMVTIASDAELSDDSRVKQAFFIVEPSGDQLTLISTLLDSKQLRTSVKAVLPLCEAGEAYRRKNYVGFGKVVLRVGDQTPRKN